MVRMRTRSGMTAIKLWMTDELLAKLTEEAKATGTARQTLISYILASHFRQTYVAEPKF